MLLLAALVRESAILVGGPWVLLTVPGAYERAAGYLNTQRQLEVEGGKLRTKSFLQNQGAGEGK